MKTIGEMKAYTSEEIQDEIIGPIGTTELIADKELTQDKIKLENIKESCQSKKK